MLALLDERRANLAAQRTRLVNQLHALRDLIPGGAETDLIAARAARVLATVRPAAPVEAARKELGRDLVAEVREVDARLAKMSTQMAQTTAEHGSRLPEVDGSAQPPSASPLLRGRTGGIPSENDNRVRNPMCPRCDQPGHRSLPRRQQRGPRHA